MKDENVNGYYGNQFERIRDGVVEKRGIGDNSKADTEDKYKSLYEHVIAMVLEPRINIEMFLKDWLETARTATKLADKFEALQRCEEIRQCYDARLEVLEYFRTCKKNGTKPDEYQWPKLLQSWGRAIHDQFKDDINSRLNTSKIFGKEVYKNDGDNDSPF